MEVVRCPDFQGLNFTTVFRTARVSWLMRCPDFWGLKVFGPASVLISEVSWFQGLNFTMVIGTAWSVLFIEVSSFQGVLIRGVPAVLFIEVSSFQGVLIRGVPLYTSSHRDGWLLSEQTVFVPYWTRAAVRPDPEPRHWLRGGAERADRHVCRPNTHTSIPSYIVIHAYNIHMYVHGKSCAPYSQEEKKNSIHKYS